MEVTGSLNDLPHLAKKVVVWAEELVVAYHADRSN